MRYMLLCLTFLVGCVSPAYSESPPPQRYNTETLAELVLDSTLKLDITKGGRKGHGTAWVIAPGVAFTAKHVVEGADTFHLTKRDGDWCSVKKVYEHPSEDMALVTFESCEVEPLNIRLHPVREGTRVFIAGHPMWSTWSFTTGTVSDADEGDRLQLDTVALPGNSGGPAVDEDGRVIGLVVSIVADPFGHTWGGETFAIPIKDCMVFFAKMSTLHNF